MDFTNDLTQNYKIKDVHIMASTPLVKIGPQIWLSVEMVITVMMVGAYVSQKHTHLSL